MYYSGPYKNEPCYQGWFAINTMSLSEMSSVAMIMILLIEDIYINKMFMYYSGPYKNGNEYLYPYIFQSEPTEKHF